MDDCMIVVVVAKVLFPNNFGTNYNVVRNHEGEMACGGKVDKTMLSGNSRSYFLHFHTNL